MKKTYKLRDTVTGEIVATGISHEAKTIMLDLERWCRATGRDWPASAADFEAYRRSRKS